MPGTDATVVGPAGAITELWRSRKPDEAGFFAQGWPTALDQVSKVFREGHGRESGGGTGGRKEGEEDDRSGPHRPRAPSSAGHSETFSKNASYMGGLREGWIEKHSNKEEATGRAGRGCSDVTPLPSHTHTHARARSPLTHAHWALHLSLNAVGFLSTRLDVEIREGTPHTTPLVCVWREVYALPLARVWREERRARPPLVPLQIFRYFDG